MTMPALGSDALPNPGDLFEGKYRIERLIGKGGMGAVFSAQHELLQKRVAVKFLLGDIVTNPEAVKRFQNEAVSASKIQGDHVAQVMDVGTAHASGLPFMVMEFLDGGDLSQLLEQRGPLPVEDAVDYVLQGLEAIAQAHKQKIVHRDLKPANLFLARRPDGSSTIKVLDFGISKQSNPFSNTGNHGLTSTKSVLGSPLYMSPEQLRSAKNVDERADIWSLGVILFELLTGHVPFNGDSLGELFVSILEQPIPRVSQIRPDVPQALDEAILRCLQRPLEQRFSNVGELAYALAQCAPPRAIPSIERIMTTLGVHPGSMGALPVPMRGPEPSFVGFGTGAGGSGAFQAGAQTGPGQPGASTQNNWGRTGSGVHGAPPPKSKAPLYAGLAVVGVVLLGGLGGVGYWAKHRNDGATAGGTGTTTTTEPTVSAPPTNVNLPPPPSATIPVNTAGVQPTVTTTNTPPTDSAKVTHTGSPTGKLTGTKPPASVASSVASAPPPPPPPPATTGTKPFDPFAAGRR